MKIKFLRKLELYEGNTLHYLANCNTKEDVSIIKKAWALKGNTNVKVKRYKNHKFKEEKLLSCYKLFKNDILVKTLWLPLTVGYYLKVYWLSEEKEKIIEIEYIHHRWPKDYYTKQVTICKPTKPVKGL